jgi:sugar/nucleoside kinase (ribokinase family)
MSLLVLGTVALDDVKTPAGVKTAMLGGSAAHFAMGARLFTDVHLVAVVGKDFPRKHLRFLRQKGISLSSLTEGAGKTFRWKGEYKKEDLNAALTLATELGVLAGFTPQVAHHQRHIPNVFLANIDPDMQLGLLKRIAHPQLVGLDSMNLWITHKRKSLLKLMKQVNLFVANDGEARALSGEANLIKAAKALRRCGPQMVVVKKGEHGALFYCDKFMFCFPAYPVDKVVDPTGAGDTFAGGLMGYLSRSKKIDEKTLKKAVMNATALASFNVEGFGMTKTATLTLGAVQRRIRELKRFVTPA